MDIKNIPTGFAHNGFAHNADQPAPAAPAIAAGNVGPGIAEDIDQESSSATAHTGELRRELDRPFPAIRRRMQLGTGSTESVKAGRIIPPVTVEIPMPAPVDVAVGDTKHVVYMYDPDAISRLAALEDEVAQLRSRLDHHGIRGPQ